METSRLLSGSSACTSTSGAAGQVILRHEAIAHGCAFLARQPDALLTRTRCAKASIRRSAAHLCNKRLQRCAATSETWTPPWAITFDLRERETEWTSENQARLVKLFAAEKLDIDVIEAELRVAQLCLIVPKLAGRLKTIKPGVLAGLLRDPSLVASRLANLKEALPEADIAGLVSNAPQILLEDDAAIVAEVREIAAALGVSFEEAQRVVSTHPRFLESELVREVLEELQRLMPGRDPKQTLLSEPTWLLRVERGPKRLGPHPDDL